MSWFKVLYDEVSWKLLLLLIWNLILAPTCLVVEQRRVDEGLQEGVEVVGKFVRIVVPVGHHLLIVYSFSVLLLLGEELGLDLADSADAIVLFLLLEHEGVLDVALLYVLCQQVEVLWLVYAPFLLIATPKRMSTVPCSCDAHHFEKIR